MALHVDCATCPAKPRACGDCSVGFLFRPVAMDPPPVTTEPGLEDAIVTFANAECCPGSGAP